jgi:hypothetical protein
MKKEKWLRKAKFLDRYKDKYPRILLIGDVELDILIDKIRRGNLSTKVLKSYKENKNEKGN